MRYCLLLLCTTLFFAPSCDPIEPDKEDKESTLIGDWKRSFEEEDNKYDDFYLYRPSDYKTFPITRYRRMYRFYTKNLCEVYMYDEGGAHYFESCTWSIREEDSGDILSIDLINSNDENYKIGYLSNNRLEIENLNLIKPD